jgi:Raf kinase inhibitor-like YbhB/YbcL family protein
MREAMRTQSSQPTRRMRGSVRRGITGGRRAAALTWLLAGSLLVSGCGLLGKPVPLSADAPLTMTVTSPDFISGVIPARFTCHGKGLSPPIFWSGVPQGTKSLAIVVDDAAAPITPRVYWIVFDIGPLTTDLQSGGVLPPNARVALNSAGRADYDPPCPAGSAHSYRFTVYALSAFLGNQLPEHPALLTAWTTIAKYVIARGTLPGRALP